MTTSNHSNHREEDSPEQFICQGAFCGFPECVRCPHYRDPNYCKFS